MTTSNPTHIELAKLASEIRAMNVIDNGYAERLDAIEAQLARFADTVEQIRDQISPTIEALSASPMFKMIAGGK